MLEKPSKLSYPSTHCYTVEQFSVMWRASVITASTMQCAVELEREWKRTWTFFLSILRLNLSYRGRVISFHDIERQVHKGGKSVKLEEIQFVSLSRVESLSRLFTFWRFLCLKVQVSSRERVENWKERRLSSFFLHRIFTQLWTFSPSFSCMAIIQSSHKTQTSNRRLCIS